MRLFAAVRSSGALWFLPVLFAWATFMPSLGFPWRSGYRVSDIAASGIGLSYSGPLVAAFTAFWFRGRARFHRTMRSTRPGVAVLFAGGWPLILGAPLAGCAAVLVSAQMLPTDLVSAQLMGVLFSVWVGCALFGALAAWALPVVVAVPACAITCFMWINYLPSTSSPLLHHMSPTIGNFSPSAQPATHGLVAVLLLTGTVALGALACLGRRTWDRTPPLAAFPMVFVVPLVAVGLSAGYLHTSNAPMSLTVTQDRTTPFTCTTHDGVEVCLWPEVAGQTADTAEAAASMNAVLQDWNLPAVTRIAQGSVPHRPADALDLHVDRNTDPEQMPVLLAGAYVVHQKEGCVNGAGKVYSERAAVLARALGVPSRTAASEYSEETVAAADRILVELEGPELGAWFTEGIDDMYCWPPS